MKSTQNKNLIRSLQIIQMGKKRLKRDTCILKKKMTLAAMLKDWRQKKIGRKVNKKLSIIVA